ncbi:MAG TPA: DUF1684 domain-containing protein [Anaerolineales bacterium]|nr:DUF1684 domain-containing protein [Anaerolineales bacterium]
MVTPFMQMGTPFEELLDYRRRVSEMYARVRQPAQPVETRWAQFRRERDALFGHHPQSALSPEQKTQFTGLDYFPYNPELRFLVTINPDVPQEEFEVELEEDGWLRMRRFGKVELTILGTPVSLSLFWLLGYGGGVFLSFRDQTNGRETYGGGRYLLDTIKHADLGQEEGKLVVDFNFAYNPSCAYNPRWHCPLPLPENWLDLPVCAGEKNPIAQV